MAALAGFLLATPDGSAIELEKLLYRENDPQAPYLSDPTKLTALPRWRSFQFHSDRSFDEATRRRLYYKYNILIFVSVSRSTLIVLSEKKKISEYLISSVMNRNLFPQLKNVSIYVDRMVEDFRKKDSRYRITSLNCRYAGPESNVRTIILYGTEVTDSSAFRQTEKLFNFTRCGVAERFSDFPAADDGEIVSLGSDGSLALNSFGPSIANQIQELVASVINNRWVDSWVPNMG